MRFLPSLALVGNVLDAEHRPRRWRCSAIPVSTPAGPEVFARFFQKALLALASLHVRLKILTFWWFLVIRQVLMRRCAPARRLSGRYFFENGTF
jgi:hypothetical protein